MPALLALFATPEPLQLGLAWEAALAQEKKPEAPAGPTYYDRTRVKIDVGDQGATPVRCPHLEGRTHEEHLAHCKAKRLAWGQGCAIDLGPWAERTPENMAFQGKELNDWTHYDHFDAHCEEVRQEQEKRAQIAAGTWVELPAPKYRKPTMDERFCHWEPARIAERYRCMEGLLLTPRQIANRKDKAAAAKANDKRVDRYLEDLGWMTLAEIDRKYGKNLKKHPRLSLCKAQKELDAHTEADRFIKWADRLPAKRRGIRKARRARKIRLNVARVDTVG